MYLLGDFRATRSEHWRDSMMWLLYTLIGGLVPFWGSALLILLFDKWRGFTIFYQHGEFAIYSAPLLAFALYTINKDKKSVGFKSRSVFALFACVGLLVAMIIFAGVTSKELFSNFNITLDLHFLRDISLYLFLDSVLVAFLSFLFDSARTIPDLEEVRTEEIQGLEDDFDALKGGQ